MDIRDLYRLYEEENAGTPGSAEPDVREAREAGLTDMTEPGTRDVEPADAGTSGTGRARPGDTGSPGNRDVRLTDTGTRKTCGTEPDGADVPNSRDTGLTDTNTPKTRETRLTDMAEPGTRDASSADMNTLETRDIKLTGVEAPNIRSIGMTDTGAPEPGTGLHGRAVQIEGWVRSNRASREFGFLEINDGTDFRSVQVVYEKAFLNHFQEIAKLPIAAAITVQGILELTPQARQPFEIKAKTIRIDAGSASDYPLQKKRHSMEFLREIAHLRPRSNTFSAVFRVRSLASMAIHTFFQERGFVYVHTPILTGNDAEGAGEMFRVVTSDPADSVDSKKEFFGKPAWLTVSGQLEAEIFALAFKNVYTFGPTFRAEDSNTTRHASEFWMVEPEMAFADLEDDMEVAEAMIKSIIRYVLAHAPQEMDFFDRFVAKGVRQRMQDLAEADFARITYTEAVALLQKSGRDFVYPVEWGIDLQTEHERYLTDVIFRGPVFVTDYPKDIKAFYMRLNDNGKTVAAMDLLVPGIGEIIGGSQREERPDVLEARIREPGMNPAAYDWYLDLRNYGGVRHAGFGLGLERMIMYLTGMQNIRDVIPFPRTPRSLEF